MKFCGISTLRCDEVFCPHFITCSSVFEQLCITCTRFITILLGKVTAAEKLDTCQDTITVHEDGGKLTAYIAGEGKELESETEDQQETSTKNQIEKAESSVEDGESSDEDDESSDEDDESSDEDDESSDEDDESSDEDDENSDEDKENSDEDDENSDEDDENSDEDDENKASEIEDDADKFPVRKLYVHSQWLSAQSSYFRALFYSGMKETYSEEVVMKVYDHEFEAHLVLIEAMYKLDVLDDKDYRLIVQVLVLANKYDVPLVIKKCKYVLLATTPSLEMCEYILLETEHLTEMDDVNDMLEAYFVKEFTPIDKTWTREKFTGLSKLALKLLLKSDSLSTQSENTIFVALMKWVGLNIPYYEFSVCDLLHLVRFEFLSVDFLYDVVQNHPIACIMPGFNKYLLNGLAYHSFSEIRRDQLKSKPKKRPSAEDDGPTFSWVIDEKLHEKLTECPGVPSFSDKFWHQGYQMELRLKYLEDSSQCAFYLNVCNLKGEAFLHAGCRAKSNLFASNTIQLKRKFFTAGSSRGYGNITRNQHQIRGTEGYTIDVWVEV